MSHRILTSGYCRCIAYSIFCIITLLANNVSAAVMNDYCIRPPFVSQSSPPMVMFEVGRDHKLYYEAYNDGVDLDGDGRIERTYDHSIEYYGYFNPYKCYTAPSGSTQNDYFTPVATNTDRFCSSGQWGGNILNWLTMSRMDVLRKVMYGGQRSKETPNKLLNRVYIPQDAHSWGKEYTGKLCYNSTSGVYKAMCSVDSDCDTGYTCTDKSVNLIGMVKPVGGDVCSGFTITWGAVSTQGEKKMLVVRYPNSSGITGSNHAEMLTAYDTTQFYTGFSPQYVTDFGDSILNPTKDHGNKYAQVVVSEFQVPAGEGGTWYFAIDGDDAVEMELLTTAGVTVVPAATTSTSPYIAYYGAHGRANNQDHNGSYSLTAGTWYRMVVRHNEASGGDGVNVWYKKPGDANWVTYGYKKDTLTIRAPDIEVGNNDCTLKSANFIVNGAPENTGTASVQKRHLFCNTTLSGGVPSSDQATSILRLITDSNHRIWEWASKERPVCDDTFSDGSSASTNRTDYTVQVEVCKSGVGTLSMDDRFERCRSYGGTWNASTRSYSGGSYVPVGLFQKYGEVEFDDAGSEIKVCSKSMGKTCNTDSDCGTGEGLCFTKAPMYFGLMTTSYTKNTSGGVLRKNPGPVFDEVNNNNGYQQTSENERGNLINSINRLKTIDFNYGSHSYDNCGWILNRPMSQGECKMWGNPIAEMMYESLRYFAGKGDTSGGGQTAEFDYSTTADSGVSLSKPKWGYNKGSVYYKPYEIFPTCSQPFILLLSDVNTSFDSDQIPGSLYKKTDNTYFTEDAALPQLGLGVETAGKSLLNTLTDYIGQIEGINGNGWFIGESGGTTDFICSAKTIANLSQARGMCPEEPTKRGAYYAAALAYYGKTQFAAKTGFSPVNTFVVAMSSPFADIKVKAGSGYVNVVPVGKSVYGGGTDKCLGYGTCSLTDAGGGNYQITGCPTDAFCPTNSLVDFYLDDMKYDSSNDIIYAKFRINFEDVEQGADHDMDAIASYELCTQAAATAHYGSCTGTISGLQIKVKSEYASGGVAQLLGFIVSGTTADGPYMVVKDVDTGSGAISTLPIEWSKDFTVSSSASGNYLKNPLWYAAKWGGFTGTTYPQTTSSWDKNNDGFPDTYFLVSNPLQLDEQLEKALTEILARVASGTAASILNNSEGSGANLLQAVFYPMKTFANGTEANWIGEIQNLWYYLDPYLQRTSIREDTVQNNTLDLIEDRVSQFTFDPNTNTTMVHLFTDNNGDGAADTAAGIVDPDDVRSLWKAGRQLWGRSLSTSPRTLYTGYNSTSGSTPQLFDNSSFNTSSSTAVWNTMQIPSGTNTERNAKATKLINWISGTDQTADADGTAYRNRKITSYACSTNKQQHCAASSECPNSGTCNLYTYEWKLGDIVNSTPKLVSNVKLNNYNLNSPTGYGDNTYTQFLATSTYQNRGMAFVGSNDGMLHAFKLGVLQELSGATSKAMIINSTSSCTATGCTAATLADELGKEMWAFIPKNALPYLKYLADPSYPHLFFVDRTPTIIDASVGTPASPSGDCATDYSACIKDATTWRTILIGGMGMGGAAKSTADSCTAPANCVKTPVAGTGYSSYFALDVTDPANPLYLWEFTGSSGVADLGYSTTGPSVVRIASKNVSGTPDHTKNGKWYAVFASGPTGPIDTIKHEFKGQSDQNLKLFIVDLISGTLARTIDTGVTNAFGGSLSTAAIDTDRSVYNSNGYYSDDAVYIGYTQKDTSVTPNTWTRGGVLRLLTKETADVSQWAVSSLISGTGPVTTSITKAQDRRNNNLWIFFGTGRYFYKQDDPSATTQQRLYGVKEPCYSTCNRTMMDPVISPCTQNDIDQNCSDAAVSSTTTTCSTPACTGTLSCNKLCDQSGDATTAPAATLPNTMAGWVINLDPAVTTSLSERVITDPIASASGAVFFTTFKPSSDICQYGGETNVWAPRYDSGGLPPSAAMQGKALLQVSTGAFAEISLATAFSGSGSQRYEGRRTTTPISGVPPTGQGLSLISNPPPAKKMLHIREK